MVGVGQRLIADVRAELFTHLQALSMAYHDQHKVGDLMSRVTNDSEAINQVLSNGLITFITNILTLGGIMVSMFLLNWQLAIGTLILLPLMVYITAPGHASQPGGFPGSAAQFGDDERGDGRKYRRDPGRQSLCPGRRYDRPI